MKKTIAGVVAAGVVAVAGAFALGTQFDDAPASASASAETVAIGLIEDAKVHLKATTITYPKWRDRVYPPGVVETTEWYLAFSKLDEAQRSLVPPPPPPPTETTTPTTTAPPPPPTETTPTTTAPPPPPPPQDGVANLWVDANGGTCARASTRSAYSDAAACSWTGAYAKAVTGDLILVRSGSYGDVTLGPNRTAIAAPGIVFQTAFGADVVVRDLENGRINSSTGASNVSFVGPVTARTFRSDQASNVNVDGWLVDCNACTEQMFHIESASNVMVRNSEIRDNTDNSMIWISGTNIAFERNLIHDAGLRSGSGAHTECIYAWNVTNLTLKGNRFYHCSVMDVFITGSNTANGGYVENNVFGRPWSTTGQLGNGLAFHFRDGTSDPRPHPTNWQFRYNTFEGPLSISSSTNAPTGPVRIVGNWFRKDASTYTGSAPSCSLVNTTYSHNAGACGGPANPVDAGDPSDYPAIDIGGTRRPLGLGPDAEAVEER